MTEAPNEASNFICFVNRSCVLTMILMDRMIWSDHSWRAALNSWKPSTNRSVATMMMKMNFCSRFKLWRCFFYIIFEVVVICNQKENISCDEEYSNWVCRCYGDGSTYCPLKKLKICLYQVTTFTAKHGDLHVLHFMLYRCTITACASYWFHGYMFVNQPWIFVLLTISGKACSIYENASTM